MLRSLARLKNEIYEILCVRRDEFSGSLFKTVATELSIGYDDGIKGYEVPLPDGGKLVIYGSVDRVDLMDEGETRYVRVVDYTTGGKDFKLSDVYYGLNMQMLIYLYAICENGAPLFGQTTPAGILYVPAKNSGTPLERGATEDEVKQRRLENGRMNGMVLAKESVIRGMEKDARGVYINASIDEKGVLKGNLLSLEEFGLLHKKIDEILQDIGMNIHGGKIAAVPTEHDNTVPCTYCDYAAVCLKEDGARHRVVKNLRHDDAAKLLREEKSV